MGLGTESRLSQRLPLRTRERTRRDSGGHHDDPARQREQQPPRQAARRRSDHLAGGARELLVHEKAHTREGDAIAAARRRLPMVELDGAVEVTGVDGPVPFVNLFQGWV
jgi:Bacterial protein of unknown function (DUF899)